MVEPGADQASKARYADYQETFVFFVFSGNALELRSATVEIGLQDVGRDEHGGGDHQPKRGDGQWSKMEEGDHVLASERRQGKYT